MKRIIILLIAFVLSAAGQQAFAQTVIEQPGLKYGGKQGTIHGYEGMISSKADARNSLPSGYKGYSDEELEQYRQKMREEEWRSEDTAWIRASEADNSYSYERYLAIFPYGAHAPEASVRLVRAKVNETLANAHNDLPTIKRTVTDDESTTSIIEIQNNTGYTLTVWCSGIESRSVVIPPDKKATVTVTNGQYKLAAAVPPSHIRPFAGQSSFAGGKYEIGFWVVQR